MATYILTYDIPNEDRERLESALTKGLHAKREYGVSTFWRAESTHTASDIRDVLKELFPKIKLYVYEVNPANAATTELNLEELLASIRSFK